MVRIVSGKKAHGHGLEHVDRRAVNGGLEEVVGALVAESGLPMEALELCEG